MGVFRLHVWMGTIYIQWPQRPVEYTRSLELHKRSLWAACHLSASNQTQIVCNSSLNHWNHHPGGIF